MYPLLPFSLDQNRYGLNAQSVTCVVAAAEITPLPKAPEIILGIINLHGTIVPVLDVRKRFRLSPKPLSVDDVFIIASTSRRPVALVADSVSTVIELPHEEIASPQESVPGLEFVQGIVKRPDGLILIHNLDTFLSLEEEHQLDQSLSG